MHELTLAFEAGHVSKKSINSTLTAYNNSCTEMRSEERDAFINAKIMHAANSMGKNECKQRAAEIYDEALFKDPPAKEDCPK